MQHGHTGLCATRSHWFVCNTVTSICSSDLDFFTVQHGHTGLCATRSHWFIIYATRSQRATSVSSSDLDLRVLCFICNTVTSICSSDLDFFTVQHGHTGLCATRSHWFIIYATRSQRATSVSSSDLDLRVLCFICNTVTKSDPESAGHTLLSCVLSFFRGSCGDADKLKGVGTAG